MNYHAKEIEERNCCTIVTLERVNMPPRRKRRKNNARVLAVCAAVGVLSAALVFTLAREKKPLEGVEMRDRVQVVSVSNLKSEYSTKKPVIVRTAERVELTEAGEDFENEKIEAALLAKANVLESVKITFYCCEKRAHICGTGDGITASGMEVTPYVTVAVDPSVIPLGSEVMVDFGDGVIHYFIAADTGGAVKGNHIDIAVESHQQALELGTRTATVWYIKE